MPLLRWLCCTASLSAPQALANQTLSDNTLLAEQSIATFQLGVILPAIVIGLALGIILLAIFNQRLRRKNRTLNSTNSQFNAFLQQSDDVIAILATDSSTRFINPALAKLLNTSPGMGSSVLPLFVKKDSAQLLLNEIDFNKGWQGEAWIPTGNERIPLSVVITAPLPPDAHHILLGRDISQTKQQQQQVNSSVLYDTVTGLYSPVLMTEYLHTLIHVSNTTHLPFAVMLVKQTMLLQPAPTSPVSDMQKNLLQLANRMSELVNKGCIIARYSADTLAVLIPQHLCRDNTELQLNRIAHRILKLAEQIVAASGTQLQTTIGISLFSTDSDSATELILAASSALGEAAKLGFSCMAYANAPFAHRSNEYQTLESELQKAIAQDEFELYYQPRVSIGSNRVIGYEALLRWHNPRRGILLPQHFISIADETGLTTQLDRLAFNKCCHQLQLWQQTDMSRGRVALNISGLSLQQNDFVAYLVNQMAAFGHTADMFELELHEDTLLQTDEQIQASLQQLAKLGFHLTLDNFGEGISSLSVLRQQPLNSVKIAQSYIKDMEHNEQQRNITASLIRLASYLQLDAIACGIENEMQAYLLHVMGCDILQGHLFSKAIPASEIPAVLAKENRLVRKALS